MKQSTIIKVMFAFFVLVFIAFIGKLLSERSPQMHISTRVRKVIKRNFDKPKDFEKEKHLSDRHRRYYDYLFDKTE